MKTKETATPTTSPKTPVAMPEAKPKSLRPMRSMVALRSFKPKTAVTSFVKTEVETEKR